MLRRTQNQQVVANTTTKITVTSLQANPLFPMAACSARLIFAHSLRSAHHDASEASCATLTAKELRDSY
jgi:hypothetical protein